MTHDPILLLPAPIETPKLRQRPGARRVVRGFFAMLSALSLLLCSFFAAKHTTAPNTEEWLRLLLFGGLVSVEPAREDDVLPVIAEPIDDSPIQPPSTVSLFATLYDAPDVTVPDGCFAIVPCDLSTERDDELKLYNDTWLTPDVNVLKNAPQQEVAADAGEAPLVLIVHTHGTEAYSEEGIDYYSDTENVPRSSDITKNVVAVGTALAERLNANGIGTIHCEVMHDAESYLGSYERSAESIKEMLARYPSIRYVFDVHRDSVLYGDGRKARPVTICNGKITAQVLTVVGTNELGDDHPNWGQNLSFAAKLQNNLNTAHLGFARAICLRSTSYNQELAAHSLLLEVGSCGNTLTEALAAAEVLGDTLATMIRSGW